MLTGAGETVLALALGEARRLWGARLLAAYALGSLEHGGFCCHVSDVDFAAIIDGPLADNDAGTARELCASVKSSGVPLSDRLSFFWGSPATIAGDESGGRFSPIDLLDLKEHGRLLFGVDITGIVRVPSTAEMVTAIARHALKKFASNDALARYSTLAEVRGEEVRTLVKLILSPVRYLYTARTGYVGSNGDAVEYYSEADPGPVAELVQKTLHWRYHPFERGDAVACNEIARGIIPLYRLFVRDYEERLHDIGEKELSREFAGWLERMENW